MYYFEVEILDTGVNNSITIGFSAEYFLLNRQPGFEAGSYGYRADDGYRYGGSAEGEAYGPTCVEGDVMGAGINFDTQEVFFTKNGEYLGAAFRGVELEPVEAPVTEEEREMVNWEYLRASPGAAVALTLARQGFMRGEVAWYPTVALHSPGERVRLNLSGGRAATTTTATTTATATAAVTPFLFDMDGAQREAERQQLAAAARAFAVPPEVTRAIVADYLRHSGCARTLRLFEQAYQRRSDSDAAAAAALGVPAVASTNTAPAAAAAAAASSAAASDATAAVESGAVEQKSAPPPEPPSQVTASDPPPAPAPAAAAGGVSDDALEQRCALRALVLSGDAKQALADAKQAFPVLFRKRRHLRAVFWLNCQVFIELIAQRQLGPALRYARSQLKSIVPKQSAAAKPAVAPTATATAAAAGMNGGTVPGPATATAAAAGSEEGAGVDNDGDEAVGDAEAEAGDDGQAGEGGEEELEELRKSLKQVLGLLAYRSPATSPLAHLLQPGQRKRVAALLNDAICVECGLSADGPMLQTLLQHLTVTRHALRQLRGGRGAVFSVQTLLHERLSQASGAADL